MITKDQIKEHQTELQETFDEFYKACKVAIHPDDNIVNEEVRQHALKCARLYISQIQHQMSEILEQCQPTAEVKA
jgi:translation initiation factor 2 beta subunit (eIF-2beta)/eIF-5